MAEYCLDCLNEMNKKKETLAQYYYSKNFERCERCGELKHIIIKKKKKSFLKKLLSYYIYK